MCSTKTRYFVPYTHRNLRKAAGASLNHSIVEEHHYVPWQTTAFSEAIENSIFTPDIIFILHENFTLPYSKRHFLPASIVLLHCIAGVA